MKAEIIAVGTELLLGQIVNTNAQYISKQLAEIGIDVYFQTVVGDNRERIQEALRMAQQRADVIVLTGGLGPTEDDLTRDAVAEFTGNTLAFDRAALQQLETYFHNRGMAMTENNRRQALFIEGADVLPNDAGLAIGSALQAGNTLYILLPGPPKELKPMFERYAKPWLLKHLGQEIRSLHSVMLKFAGIGESILADRLADLIDGQHDPTIAPYAQEGEVTIRVSTKASDPAEAERKMRPVLDEIKKRAGEHLYAETDIPLEQAIVEHFAQNGWTAAAAESCTGGLISEMITSVPGSSRVFAGGIVSYTNEIKHQWLGIPMSELEGQDAHGAVSRETAKLMAEQIRERMNCRFGVSITGVAGPSPSEGKPVGLVYIGISEQGKQTQVFEERFNGDRVLIRWRAAKRALYLLWKSSKNME
ncbi:competence/damage-inducible protein A [Marinicrinis lubricantis]|uniref:Putative competence-damage inducible protein n=1 Tax=Marinicrinis lubricantis TaxID=2086470 RepID=A0ABW1IM77_9BACL